MSLFEKIYFTVFGLLVISTLMYWGNLAWFHPDKLKQKFMKDAKRNPDWLFIKGYSLEFTEKYSILMMRLITLLGALSVLTVGILISISLVGK
jgi:hypothetical protein